jgi:hypothetical protein
MRPLLQSAAEAAVVTVGLTVQVAVLESQAVAAVVQEKLTTTLLLPLQHKELLLAQLALEIAAA